MVTKIYQIMIYYIKHIKLSNHLVFHLLHGNDDILTLRYQTQNLQITT